ncbi:MAG: hypothetical protein ABII00_05045 [Elusimicrobiota bacterium]
MERRFSSRERITCALTIGLVVLAPVVKLVVEPTFERWTSLHGRIEAMETRLQKGRRLLNQETRIRKAHERLALPARQRGSDQEEMGKFLKAIEGLARKSFLTITDLRPLPVEDGKSHKVYAVEMETRAPVLRLTRFLYGVQIASPPMQVEMLSLLSGKASTSAKLIISKVMITGKARAAGKTGKASRTPK